MADEDKGAQTGAGPQDVGGEAPIPPEMRGGGPGIRVMAQFIRDLSFENPRAPESLRAETAPKSPGWTRCSSWSSTPTSAA